MDATPASLRSVGLSGTALGRSSGCNSDQRGRRLVVMLEFYTTALATGRDAGSRATPTGPGWRTPSGPAAQRHTASALLSHAPGDH